MLRRFSKANSISFSNFNCLVLYWPDFDAFDGFGNAFAMNISANSCLWNGKQNLITRNLTAFTEFLAGACDSRT